MTLVFSPAATYALLTVIDGTRLAAQADRPLTLLLCSVVAAAVVTLVALGGRCPPLVLLAVALGAVVTSYFGVVVVALTLVVLSGEELG